MTERFAIYFAPAASSLLWRRAGEWLGRNAVSEHPIETSDTGLTVLHLRGVTRSARRYGFHATLKAPLRLAPGTTRAKLEEALAYFALQQSVVPVGPVRLALLDGFLAVVPVEQPTRLTAFAQSVVEAFEPFRAPLTAEERASRIERGSLTERQIELLDLFGYPYVAEEFRFHMTLTDRLVATDRPAIVDAAERWFADALKGPLRVDRLVLFHESQPGAPFLRLADFPLSMPTRV